MDQKRLTKDNVYPFLSDDELGRKFLNEWIDFLLEKKGIKRDDFTVALEERLVEESGRIDSASVEHAPVESILRKACSGEYAAAGRMYREYLYVGGQRLSDERYAPIGRKHKQNRSRAGTESGKSRKEDASPWQTKCVNRAKKFINDGTNSRDLVSKLKALSEFADRNPKTIREVLKKAGVK